MIERINGSGTRTLTAILSFILFFFASPSFHVSLIIARMTSRIINICGQRYVNMAVQEDAKTQKVGLSEPNFFQNDGKDQAITMV